MYIQDFVPMLSQSLTPPPSTSDCLFLPPPPVPLLSFSSEETRAKRRSRNWRRRRRVEDERNSAGSYYFQFFHVSRCPFSPGRAPLESIAPACTTLFAPGYSTPSYPSYLLRPYGEHCPPSSILLQDLPTPFAPPVSLAPAPQDCSRPTIPVLILFSHASSFRTPPHRQRQRTVPLVFL